MAQIDIKQVDDLQEHLDLLYSNAGTVKSEYTQASHGFSAGDVIAFYSNSWTLADASTADKIGRLVVESATTDTFVAVHVGEIEVANWTLTPGKFYVVTGVGDGSIAEYISPTNPDVEFSNPVLQAISSTQAHVLPWRPSLGFNTTTDPGIPSDYRLKENVIEMTKALNRLNDINPLRFNFISDPEKTVDGFLAHEVQKVVPEAVMGEKDGVDENGNPVYQKIDQSKLVPLLVGAIQELKELIMNQQIEIETLKQKIL